MPEKAIVAMSGGVDSSVAAALMLKAGCDCSGVTLRLHDSGGTDKSAAEAACSLGIPHLVLDRREEFKNRVILPFIKSYEEGYTPNPCVACNRYIKFAFQLYTSAGAFDLFATGHYAQTEKSGGRILLKKAVDTKKDQSYVLFGLDQETLARCSFPLGVLTKKEVREIARKLGFGSAAQKESQDICFVPDVDYGAFIEDYTGTHCPPGDILDTAGKIIGRHRGHIRYTLGQRRGLGVAVNRPIYVCAKNAASNTVTLGDEASLYAKALTFENINLIACDNLEKPIRLKVKTRYMQDEHEAIAFQTGPDEIRVEFYEAQRALSPGQAAVLYDGSIVVGGGLIKSVER